MDVKQFWHDVLRQDAVAIRAWFAEDAYVNWHCTNEHFTVNEFIRANCEYPGDWDGEVERVLDLGDRIVTVTRVWSREPRFFFHVNSWLRVENGKILSIDEYWGDDGKAPQWRQEMRIGRPIQNEKSEIL